MKINISITVKEYLVIAWEAILTALMYVGAEALAAFKYFGNGILHY